MVIDNGDVVGVAPGPTKADAPLIICANAVLPGAIAAEFLQAVAGRYAQIFEPRGRVDLHELPQHDAAQFGGKPPDGFACPEAFRIAVRERVDHAI